MTRTKTQYNKNDLLAKTQYGGFYKSSFSGTGNCVAVARCADGGMLVRDTKDLNKQTLKFTHDEWVAFVKGVKNNEFDTN